MDLENEEYHVRDARLCVITLVLLKSPRSQYAPKTKQKTFLKVMEKVTVLDVQELVLPEKYCQPIINLLLRKTNNQKLFQISITKCL